MQIPSLSQVLPPAEISKTQAQAAVKPDLNLGSADGPQLPGQRVPKSRAHPGPVGAPVPASGRGRLAGRAAQLSGGVLSASAPAGMKELFIRPFPFYKSSAAIR